MSELMKKMTCISVFAVALAGCISDPVITEPALNAGKFPSVRFSHEDSLQLGDRVFFAHDRYDLSPDARRTLERQSAYLKQYGDVRFIIQGHADEHGTREYNLALGERRAAVVKDYLVALGVPATRLATVSYGKERPAVLGSNEAAWSQNRRAQSVVQQN
jgi:peptidoglycan-associated lipoprotein